MMSLGSYNTEFNSPDVPSLDDGTASPQSLRSSPESLADDERFVLHEKRKAFGEQQTSDRLKSARQVPGKKVGRKQETSEPESKRKAQNRAAQRAFRERKERHLKELEERVNALEQEQQATTDENELLRAQVQALQGELATYKSARAQAGAGPGPAPSAEHAKNRKQFTFEYPFFADANARDQEISSKASVSSVEGVPGLLDSSPEYVSSGTSPAFTDDSHHNSLSSASNQEHFCDNLSLACGTCENPGRSAADARPKQNSFASNTSEPQNTELDRLLGLATKKPSEKPLSLDMFNDYRDPAFDNDDGFLLPDLTTEDSIFDPFADQVSFENMLFNPDQFGDSTVDNSSMSPLTPATPATPAHLSKAPAKAPAKAAAAEESVPVRQEKLITCRDVWDRITTHPKFGDLDIDGLCSELKMKAKCSERGVLVSQEEVDKVLSSI